MHWINEKRLGTIIDENNQISIANLFYSSKQIIIEKGTSIRNMEKVRQAYNQILN